MNNIDLQQFIIESKIDGQFKDVALKELMQRYQQQLQNTCEMKNRLQRCQDCICLTDNYVCDELQKHCVEIKNCPEK